MSRIESQPPGAADPVLLTAAQMRALEAAEIARGAAVGAELMDRAGRAVVAALHARWPGLAAAPGRAAVLCGPGNNGGAGYVITAALADWGWQVTVLGLGAAAALPPDAAAARARWAARGAVGPLGPAALAAAAPDLVVDALFGTGLARPLGGEVAATLTAAAAGSARLVAVDIPSGLCADSGRVLGAACPAALTVTFHGAKPGHLLAEGPALCGTLEIADIGLRPAGPPPAGAARRVGAPAGLGKTGGHKYAHGHALVLSGGLGRSGAARLAARAALRVGAGLVTVAAPEAALPECAAQLTAIMLRRCDGAGDLAALLADPRLGALCLGPGLGTGAATRALVGAALAAAPARAVVLDADALTAFAAAPETLFAQLRAPCVLTPHDGEFARLFPDLAAPLAAPAAAGPAPSRLDAARAAAARAGCVVLLKGPDTVIAAPDGTAAIHAAAYGRAAPWLATAGAGDVLAGLIAGLMARGMAPAPAAAAAAWLHVEAARHAGPGLIAEDLPEALPAVLRGLGA